MLKKKYQDFIRGNKLTLAAFALQINRPYPGKLTPTTFWNVEAQIHQWLKNKRYTTFAFQNVNIGCAYVSLKTEEKFHVKRILMRLPKC